MKIKIIHEYDLPQDLEQYQKDQMYKEEFPAYQNIIQEFSEWLFARSTTASKEEEIYDAFFVVCKNHGVDIGAYI